MMSLPTVRSRRPDRVARGVSSPGVCRPPGAAGRAGGFTVIELMMAVMILAIIIALGAPSMVTFVTQSRMTSQINDLLADISYARNEAATRGVRIGFCASANPTSAAATCSGATSDWVNGRIVFVDTDGDGQRSTVAASTELLLRVSDQLTGNSSMTISQTGSTTPPASFQFRPYGGMATAGNPSISPVTFKLCPNNGTGLQGRQIDIALTGRPNVSKVGC